MRSLNGQSVGTEDQELLQRAREGEAEAFCQLAQRLEQRLFQQAVVLCRNTALAEDLVAETLVEGWKSLRRFDASCRLSTWLYAILVHRFQKAIRKARSRPVPLASLPTSTADERELLMQRLCEDAPRPSDALLHKELSGQIRQAIAGLPPKHQEVVWLRFYEGASLSEIAAALGLSVGTVKSRLHHALKRLGRMKSIVNLYAESGDTNL